MTSSIAKLCNIETAKGGGRILKDNNEQVLMGITSITNLPVPIAADTLYSPLLLIWERDINSTGIRAVVTSLKTEEKGREV